MELILSGILFGLLLAIMLGPIFVVTINGTINHGQKAGFAITSGVWISDLSIILVSYFFVSRMKTYLENPKLVMILTILGAVVFIAIGLGNVMKKPNKEETFAQKVSIKNISEFLLQGWLVNTVNPFTFFFWLTIMSTKVVSLGLSPKEIILYVGAIFVTIVVTDSLKVVLADRIRNVMKPIHFLRFRQIAGIGLVGFGLYLVVYAFS